MVTWVQVQVFENRAAKQQTHKNIPKMIATIEQIINLLDVETEPENMVNFSVKSPAYWKSIQAGKVHDSTNKNGDWDYVVLDKGLSTVKDVLKFLKQLVPEFKDRYVALYVGDCALVSIATAKLTENKLFDLDFSKDTRDLPKFVVQPRKEAFVKFNVMIEKFNKAVGSSHSSLIPLAQNFIIDNPDLGQLYLIGTTFYPSFSDVQTAYPEITDSQKDDLFKPCDHGVFVCSHTSDEIKTMCKQKTQYVSDVGTFSREELLEKFKLTDAQIDKLFTNQGGVMICGVDGLLETLAK